MRARLYYGAWLIGILGVVVWEWIVDAPVACGWPWDWRVMATASCSLFSVIAEMLLTAGAFGGLAVFGERVLSHFHPPPRNG